MATEISKKEYYAMRYPTGTIVELLAPIDDRYTPKPIGSLFEVHYVDDMLQMHGSWLAPQRGSLAIKIEEDSFQIVDEENIKRIQFYKGYEITVTWIEEKVGYGFSIARAGEEIASDNGNYFLYESAFESARKIIDDIEGN